MCFEILIILISSVSIGGFIDLRAQKHHIISVLFDSGCFVLNLCEYILSQSHCYTFGKGMASQGSGWTAGGYTEVLGVK